MRISKSLMTGAVAAVAVAGSASASAVVIDNFTFGSFNRQNITATNTGGFSPKVGFTDGSIFALPGSNNTRTVGAGTSNGFPPAGSANPSTASFTSSANGSANVSMTGNWGTFGTTTSAVDLIYGKPQNDTTGAAASSVDLSSFTALTIFGSGTANVAGTNLSLGNRVIFTIHDASGASYNTQSLIAAGAVGNISLDLSTVTGINKTQVRSIWIQFNLDGINFSGSNAGSGSLNYDISSVQLVPAPGALALLGAAGLVGARRRR
jgi:hypothetical protein